MYCYTIMFSYLTNDELGNHVYKQEDFWNGETYSTKETAMTNAKKLALERFKDLLSDDDSNGYYGSFDFIQTLETFNCNCPDCTRKVHENFEQESVFIGFSVVAHELI